MPFVEKDSLVNSQSKNDRNMDFKLGNIRNSGVSRAQDNTQTPISINTVYANGVSN